MADLSRKIKKTRLKKAWSQETLARRAGISYNTLIKIESGKVKNPGIDTIYKIAHTLNVSIDRLVKGCF